MAGAWIESYTPLAGLEPAARDALARLPVTTLRAGKTLFAGGDQCPGFVLVLAGVVRVSLPGPTGRNLVLYRVGIGETCVQTTLCMTGGGGYTGLGETETDVQLAIIPPPLFEDLMASSSVFRHFVFSRFGARFSEMMQILEAVAFSSIDARLAQCLLTNAQNATVAMTHQQLADEISPAREVVSRHLKQFAGRKLIQLGRGQITIVSQAGLKAISCEA